MEVIYAIAEKCMGCRTCELSCAAQHSEAKSLVGALLGGERPHKRLFVEGSDGMRLPVLCRHCDDAPCMGACISGCLYRDDNGFIRRQKEKCIGCWSCVMSCPFGVATRDADKHIALKCDRCHKLDIPACVASCPTRALVLRDVKDITAQKRHSVVLAEKG
jgi:carbon-monoxide dehydrogenase iron sulfur subunit